MARSRKKPGRVAMTPPLASQRQQSAFGQRYIAVLLSLPGTNVQDHAPRIDVLDLQAQAFSQAQPARVDHAQTAAMVRFSHLPQDLPDFLQGQNDRKARLARWTHQNRLLGPAPLERLLEQELDRADEARAGWAAVDFDGFKVDEELPQLFNRDRSRRSSRAKLREPFGCPQIDFLCLLRIPVQSHVIEHPFLPAPIGVSTFHGVIPFV